MSILTLIPVLEGLNFNVIATFQIKISRMNFKQRWQLYVCIYLIKPTSCNYCKGKSSKSTCKSFITSLYCNFEVFTIFVLEKNKQ